ncbi:hypothetical protein [Flyfo microvirus Tbat2_144]|nr:hypothetical protein [Flyfo microvirus Tbat2_144]
MAKRDNKRVRRDDSFVSRSYTRPDFSRSRDLHDPSSSPPPSLVRVSPRPVVYRAPTPAIADNRFYHPLGDARSVYTYSGQPARVSRLYDAPRPLPTRTFVSGGKKAAPSVVRRKAAVFNRFGPNLDRQTRAIPAFSEPVRVPICRQRQVRKEVLHAFRVAGRSGGIRKPRYTAHSQLTCR